MPGEGINQFLVASIAESLGELNEEVVFVGGAVIALYATDRAAGPVRPTQDVDFFVQILSISDLELFRQKLISRGFTQSPDDTITCRFRYKGVYKIDVMGTTPVLWAPSNSWFGPGLKHLWHTKINGQSVKLLSFPFFLATKFEAFHSRSGDPRTSKDFEDIVYLIDNREKLIDDIKNAPEEVKQYLYRELKEMLSNPGMQEAIRAHLEPESQTERFTRIVSILTALK